ncbi:hypothetical protein V3C99_007816 [Haemonchus contortus]
MQQTRSNAVKAILRCARETLGKLEVDRDGTERHGFEAYKHKQRTRVLETYVSVEVSRNLPRLL